MKNGLGGVTARPFKTNCCAKNLLADQFASSRLDMCPNCAHELHFWHFWLILAQRKIKKLRVLSGYQRTSPTPGTKLAWHSPSGAGPQSLIPNSRLEAPPARPTQRQSLRSHQHCEVDCVDPPSRSANNSVPRSLLLSFVSASSCRCATCVCASTRNR